MHLRSWRHYPLWVHLQGALVSEVQPLHIIVMSMMSLGKLLIHGTSVHGWQVGLRERVLKFWALLWHLRRQRLSAKIYWSFRRLTFWLQILTF